MPFLMKIWLFISIKEEEKHLIRPSQCKYTFSYVYLRGSAAVNMFSISNFSEFGPRGGGGRNFSIISEIQNILNYPRGSSLIGNFPKFSRFFLVMAPLKRFKRNHCINYFKCFKYQYISSLLIFVSSILLVATLS